MGTHGTFDHVALNLTYLSVYRCSPRGRSLSQIRDYITWTLLLREGAASMRRERDDTPPVGCPTRRQQVPKANTARYVSPLLRHIVWIISSTACTLPHARVTRRCCVTCGICHVKLLDLACIQRRNPLVTNYHMNRAMRHIAYGSEPLRIWFATESNPENGGIKRWFSDVTVPVYRVGLRLYSNHYPPPGNAEA